MVYFLQCSFFKQQASPGSGLVAQIEPYIFCVRGRVSTGIMICYGSSVDACLECSSMWRTVSKEIDETILFQAPVPNISHFMLSTFSEISEQNNHALLSSTQRGLNHKTKRKGTIEYLSEHLSGAIWSSIFQPHRSAWILLSIVSLFSTLSAMLDNIRLRSRASFCWIHIKL